MFMPFYPSDLDRQIVDALAEAPAEGMSADELANHLGANRYFVRTAIATLGGKVVKQSGSTERYRVAL